MGTVSGAVQDGWFAGLAQAVLLAAIIGTGIASGQAVTSGIFHWWIYPALFGLFIVTFAFYHLLDRRRTAQKHN